MGALSLTDADRTVLARGRFGRRMGFGARPAVVAIDCQRYMVGAARRRRRPLSLVLRRDRVGPRSTASPLYSAGRPRAAARRCSSPAFALDPPAPTLASMRASAISCDRPDWCLEGTEGARIAAGSRALVRRYRVRKKKPSAFHGTPLLGYLIDRGSRHARSLSAGRRAIACARPYSTPHPTISAPSFPATPCSTACRSRMRSVCSTWTGSSPT